MQDVKTANLELFYDCIDESNNILYEALHKNYFELLEMTVNNILAGDVVCDVDEEFVKKLNDVYDKIADIDFTVEDVRKAMQAIILKAFKEMNIPNGNTTPDTLGIFTAYLMTKLTKENKIAILDPLCGTGNLLHTVINHLDKEITALACDNDLWMTKITSMVSNLLSIPVEVFLQDCLNLSQANLDFIIFDMPATTNNKDGYFPYKAMTHFAKMLKPNGSMIGIVNNDFFDYDKNQEFKKALLKDCSIIGLIELPDNIFVSKPKIVLVIQKRVIEDKKNCFMVKLPSFTDVKEFNNSLMEIEAWFEKNKL